ncbi:MAG: hypothetical protein J7L99_03555, partial [Planctomycetes bacterium]|nr:hypothetical protein [Planctomycetota bacterium]
MEKAIQRCGFVAVVVFVCFAAINQGYGAINSWGDVQPPDPSTWTSDTTAYIGKDANGGISVTEGDHIVAHEAYLGYNEDASGIVTIDGVGSSWNCYRGSLYVGGSGQGTLEISNGGSVSCWYGYIGNETDSTGEVSIDGAGSSWYCEYRLSIGYYGGGTLEIS